MHIDVYSDLICPWCYIGKRQLDRVLASPAGEGVWVRWRPFQLYPQLPREGVDRATFMRARFGSTNTDTPTRIAEAAEGLDIAFDYAVIQRVPNTFDGHRLMEWVGPGEVQHRLAETLFSYYFCKGRDIGDVDVLADAAAAVGSDAAAAREMLAGEVGAEDVQERVKHAYAAGVTGVPCFVLPNGFGIPGAQPAEVLTRFIRRARELTEQAQD
jgi:predicted DsbA family dithiol-disulfide isomerase